MTTVYPLNIQLGPLELTGYGIMLMVAFFMGGWLLDRDLRSRGFRHEYAADVTVAAVIGGVIGAKLWFVAATGRWEALFDRGGLVFHGGFIGGAVAVILNSLRLKVPVRWSMDFVAPPLAAAYALGRVGCFLVGDDYGVPTSLPWGVSFPQGIPPTTAGNLARDFGVAIPEGTAPETLLAVHPTQLYETAIMLGVFMLIWRLRRHTRGTGWLFGLYLLLAGAERLLVEFVRAKGDRVLGSFTVAQLTALAIGVTGLVLLARFTKADAVAPGPYLTPPRA
jgi:phosphatidylglycerol:prolipoprotein diacylglycerol transferase